MNEVTSGRIGFVGLGRMGAGMARNLVRNGTDLMGVVAELCR